MPKLFYSNVKVVNQGQKEWKFTGTTTAAYAHE